MQNNNDLDSWSGMALGAASLMILFLSMQLAFSAFGH